MHVRFSLHLPGPRLPSVSIPLHDSSTLTMPLCALPSYKQEPHRKHAYLATPSSATVFTRICNVLPPLPAIVIVLRHTHWQRTALSAVCICFLPLRLLQFYVTLPPVLIASHLRDKRHIAQPLRLAHCAHARMRSDIIRITCPYNLRASGGSSFWRSTD